MKLSKLSIFYQLCHGWLALYLPRLFVYHSQAQVGSVQAETFKVMERRLLTAIMTPAMIAVFLGSG